jgi:hypothetical protein
MKVLKGKEKLCAVKATTFFVELEFALEMMEELSSVDEPTPSQSDSEALQGKDGTRTRARDTNSNLLQLEARICIRNLGHSRAHGCQTVSKSALLSQIRI